MTKILVVDDSIADRHLTGSILAGKGNIVVYASNGLEALQTLDRHTPDFVFTAFPLPEAHFSNLIGEIRIRYPRLPIILITANGVSDLMVQTLKNGAAIFVHKKNLGHCLARTLENVLALSRVDRRQQRLLGYMTQTESSFEFENDPALVALLVSYLQENAGQIRKLEESKKIQLGLALHEALLNAVFHGNLEVSSELRQLSESDYLQLAEERRHMVPYCERRVYVFSQISSSEAVYVIRDEGPGFDPENLPDPTHPANLDKASGRGLLLIKSSVDEMRFNQKGNQITLTKRIGVVQEGP